MTMIYTGRPVPLDGMRKLTAREAAQRDKAMTCLQSPAATQCKGQVHVGLCGGARMSQDEGFVLLDGAVMRSHALLAYVQQRVEAIALYGELGDQASAVGPWLIDKSLLADLDVDSIELPARHGLSELRCRQPLDIEELAEHLRRLCYLRTHDGERYFFRYADMRALSAMRSVLTEDQCSWVAGPVEEWRFTDRYGAAVVFKPVSRTTARPAGDLTLTAKQLGRLLDAGLGDQLCTALQDLGEHDLQPATRPEQFRLVERAADLIRSEKVESFAMQRAIACQAVRLGAEIARSPQFVQVIRASMAAGSTDALDRWEPMAAADTGIRR
jgi:hypothetical protein